MPSLIGDQSLYKNNKNIITYIVFLVPVLNRGHETLSQAELNNILMTSLIILMLDFNSLLYSQLPCMSIDLPT